MKEIRSARFVMGAAGLHAVPVTTLPEVAFAGRSNVGKSSVINMLLGRRNLARTSSKPGKTQEINFYIVNEDLYLADLPGLGYAKVSQTQRKRWRALISDYLSTRENLRLLFHLIDGRHPPMAADYELAEIYRATGVPTVILLTKTDKLSGNERSRATREVTDALLEVGLELPIILTSAKTGRGRDEVLKWIGDLAAG